MSLRLGEGGRHEHYDARLNGDDEREVTGWDVKGSFTWSESGLKRIAQGPLGDKFDRVVTAV